MKLYRTSKLTGEPHVRDIPITGKRYRAWEWLDHVSVRDAFPDLSEDDYEFIMTGITPEEIDWAERCGSGARNFGDWDSAFGEED